MIDFIEFLNLRSGMKKKKLNKLTQLFKSKPECQELHRRYKGQRIIKDKDGELILRNDERMKYITVMGSNL